MIDSSEAMVAYRLWRAERIERGIYRKLHTFYASRWQEEKDRNRAQMAEREGGPSYYAVRRSQPHADTTLRTMS